MSKQIGRQVGQGLYSKVLSINCLDKLEITGSNYMGVV